jgi:hypothetical protein
VRTINSTTMRQLLQQHSDLILLAAVSISHDSLKDENDEPKVLRFVSNTEDCVFAGNTYFGCPFELVLAPDDETTIGQTRIRVANVDQAITEAVRSCPTSPDMALEVLTIDGADAVGREVGPIDLKLLHAAVDALMVEGTLGFLVDYLNELAVKDCFTQAIAPGIFE